MFTLLFVYGHDMSKRRTKIYVHLTEKSIIKCAVCIELCQLRKVLGSPVPTCQPCLTVLKLCNVKASRGVVVKIHAPKPSYWAVISGHLHTQNSPCLLYKKLESPESVWEN
jgi:hypothetical protein